MNLTQKIKVDLKSTLISKNPSFEQFGDNLDFIGNLFYLQALNNFTPYSDF